MRGLKSSDIQHGKTGPLVSFPSNYKLNTSSFDPFTPMNNTSLEEDFLLGRNPSQSSLVDSKSQVAATMSQGAIKSPERDAQKVLKEKQGGKQNAGQKRLGLEYFVKSSMKNTYLSTLESNTGERGKTSPRGSGSGTDVTSSVSLRSQNKDKKIQNLIQVNAPMMVKDKDYYVVKLIECQNALRTKDKKMKDLLQTQKQLTDSLVECRTNEMVYKSELQVIQKAQSHRANQVSELTFKVSQLEQQVMQKEKVWSTTKSSLGFEIQSLKQALSLSESERRTQDMNQKEWLFSQQQFCEVRTQCEHTIGKNAQLHQRNVELQGQITLLKEQIIVYGNNMQSLIQVNKSQTSSLQNLVVSVKKQLQEVTLTLQQTKVENERSLDNALYGQKMLQMQVDTLTETCDQKLDEGEFNINKLKSSHDHLKFQNCNLKKFLESHQAEQVQLQSLLKLRNLELENQLKHLRQDTTVDKENSLKVLSSLNGELERQTTILLEKNDQIDKVDRQWRIERTEQLQIIRSLELKLKAATDQLPPIEDLKKTYLVVESTSKAQAEQIQVLTCTITQQAQQLVLNQKTNHDLVQQMAVMRQQAESWKSLKSALESYECCEEQARPDYSVVFSAINSTLGRQFTLWSPLLQLQTELVKSVYQNPCQNALKLLQIQETQQWEEVFSTSITDMLAAKTDLKQLTGKFKQKVKYFETRLHVCKEQDQRKTLVISDLKSNIKSIEGRIAEALDKLAKCTSLLEQANQKVLVGEARLQDAKSQLNVMYAQLKAENQGMFQRSQNVQVQLKDLLSKHYEGFYDQIVQRSQEDILRLQVFLFKVFLSTVIEVNHGIKQVFPTSTFMQELICERDQVMGQIRQYYKKLVEPEIAQHLAHYKPVNQLKSQRPQAY